MPGSIIINPSVFTDKRDAFAVAVNEALRLWMEDYEFTPEFDITPEQEAFFKDTAYAGDMVAMSKTILARIATRDTSIPRPSPEQIEETNRLLDGVMDTAGLSMADFMLASQMQEALFYDHPPTSEEEEMPDAPEGTGSTTSAMGGGDVAVEPNSPPDMVESVHAMHENTPIDRRALERVPYDSEIEFFRKNPSVSGMATEDNKVILNPYSKLSSAEQESVYQNESARVAMRDPENAPSFELTQEQEAFLNSNSYRDVDPVNRKATIAARILSGDPSAGTPTQEQLDFVKNLRSRISPVPAPRREAPSSENGNTPAPVMLVEKGTPVTYGSNGDQVDDNYNTLLGDEEFDDFLAWKKENAPRDSGEDYDLPGAYRAGIRTGGNGHMTDTFKKPNHPTFSQDSRYSTEDTPGGVWGEDDSGKPTYTPSRWMEQDSARMLDLRDYMATFEPGVKLVFPKHPKRSRARRNEEEPMAEEE